MQKTVTLITSFSVRDMGESSIEIKYRPCEKKDCEKLAEMINIASDGVVEYLFPVWSLV